MRANCTTPQPMSPAATKYASAGSAAYRKPPRAGPTMAAAVHVAEYRAMRRGNVPSGATMGGIERMAGAENARAAPKSTATANSGHTAVGSPKA